MSSKVKNIGNGQRWVPLDKMRAAKFDVHVPMDISMCPWIYLLFMCPWIISSFCRLTYIWFVIHLKNNFQSWWSMDKIATHFLWNTGSNCICPLKPTIVESCMLANSKYLCQRNSIVFALSVSDDKKFFWNKSWMRLYCVKTLSVVMFRPHLGVNALITWAPCPFWTLSTFSQRWAYICNVLGIQRCIWYNAHLHTTFQWFYWHIHRNWILFTSEEWTL